jgi:HK97 family phage portal protein
MGLIGNVLNKVRGAPTSSMNVEDLVSLFDGASNLTLKNLALETCANYIARTFSKGQIIFKVNEKQVKEDLWYQMNIRPNPNQTASEFKALLAKKFIMDGEVLVIKDGDKHYVADNFVTNYTLSGNTFTGVTVSLSDDNLSAQSGVFAQDYFQGVFTQGVNCLYLKNENQALSGFVNSLWEDYGKLFGSMIANQNRIGQVRATWWMPSGNSLDEKERKANRELREAIIQSIDSGKTTFIPNSDKVKYEEISGTKSGAIGSQITDIDKLKQSYINDVADILGIPNALLHGDMADNSTNWGLFVESVIEPLANKLSEGLAHLLIKESGYKVGKTVQMRGFKTVNIFALSESIDKLTGSGNFTRNEIREELGYAPVKGGDVFVLTKNYQEGVGNENT